LALPSRFVFRLGLDEEERADGVLRGLTVWPKDDFGFETPERRTGRVEVLTTFDGFVERVMVVDFGGLPLGFLGAGGGVVASVMVFFGVLGMAAFFVDAEALETSGVGVAIRTVLDFGGLPLGFFGAGGGVVASVRALFGVLGVAAFFLDSDASAALNVLFPKRLLERGWVLATVLAAFFATGFVTLDADFGFDFGAGRAELGRVVCTP